MICADPGHWKNECPRNTGKGGDQVFSLCTLRQDQCPPPRKTLEVRNRFAELDANGRAFLTGVLPKNQMPAVLSAQISDDPDRWVRVMYLLNHVADEFDPALNRARSDSDPLLQLTAEVVDGLIGLIRDVEG